MNNIKRPIYLAAGCDQKYLTKSMPYLHTMNHNSNIINIFFTVDFDISEKYKSEFRYIRFIGISSTIVKSPNSNKCMQHGGFLSALNFLSDESIIIFTDTDINIQRGFRDEELYMLAGFNDDDVGVNYNKTEDYSLVEEVQLLKPNVTIKELSKKYSGISELTVFNTGVIVANYKTYKKLYNLYNTNWESFKDLFGHYAKQQWLLSYIIQTNFNPRILPYVIHCHGCRHTWELRVDKKSAGHKFCIGSDIVIFKHNISHESAKEIKTQKRIIKRLIIALISAGLVCALLIIKDIIRIILRS